MKRISHEEAYSQDGACTNWAEEFFSRMRRAEIGYHHHIAGQYLLGYAQEASWREDNRRESNGSQVDRLAGLAMKQKKAIGSVTRSKMPRAHIATKQATYTLDMLHRELAGKVQQNKAEAERLHEAMKQLEAVIKLLNPAHKLNRIAVRRRKPNLYFKRGTVFRAALDALRHVGRPLTAPEAMLAMLAAKGIENAPAEAVRDLEGAVRASLRASRAVVGIGKHPTRWQTKEAAN